MPAGLVVWRIFREEEGKKDGAVGEASSQQIPAWGEEKMGKGARLRLGMREACATAGRISEGYRQWKSDIPSGWPIMGRQLQNHGMGQGCASPY